MTYHIWRVLTILAVGMACQVACGEDPAAKSGVHEMLDADLWVQTSAEYYACAHQTYNAATEKMDLALRDKQWTASPKQFESGKYQDLPPAVVVNLDETVISNTPYFGRQIKQVGQRSDYESWAKEAKCPAVPGAKKFLQHAADRDVAVIYNTLRSESMRDATIQNLKWLEFPYDSDKDEIIMGRDWGSALDKHRILVVLGDTLSDFMLDSAKPPAKRREMVAQHDDYWGLKWFIIPNPMVGQWEESLDGFNYDLNRAAEVHNKVQAIKNASESKPNAEE